MQFIESDSDFDKLDLKLFLALRGLAEKYKRLADSGDSGSWKAEDQEEYQRAVVAMSLYEASLGPVPDWAVKRNWEHKLVTGTQLLTKDGRKHGNAHIIYLDTSYSARVVYWCLTDAGSKMVLSKEEIHGGFYIGDFIGDRIEILTRFDHDDLYA